MILVTYPGGGLGIPGNTTSGPMIGVGEALQDLCSYHPRSPARCRTRRGTSSNPHSFVAVDGIESAMRESRRRFLSFRWSGRVAKMISSPSSPTHAAVTCGPPSLSSVTTCATAALSRSARAALWRWIPATDRCYRSVALACDSPVHRYRRASSRCIDPAYASALVVAVVGLVYIRR